MEDIVHLLLEEEVMEDIMYLSLEVLGGIVHLPLEVLGDIMLVLLEVLEGLDRNRLDMEEEARE